jgi:predicted nucleotidyltransferase
LSEELSQKFQQISQDLYSSVNEGDVSESDIDVSDVEFEEIKSE